jgi:excisionase family DNA binding protein
VSAYLTVSEAADAMRVPLATMRFWLTTGKIRGFKPGRHVLIKSADLAALVEASELGTLRADRAKRARAARVVTR